MNISGPKEFSSDSYEVFSDQEQKENKSTQEQDEKNRLAEIYTEIMNDSFSVSDDSFDISVTSMDHRISKKSSQTDYLSSQGLEKSVKVINDHEKKGTNPNRLVNELAFLKSEMDKCDEKMEKQTLSLTKVAYFVSKYFGLGGIGYASLLYNRTLNRLSKEQKNNVIALSVSYQNGPMTPNVKNLILPEGKGVYTGHVKDGVPYGTGEGTDIVLSEKKIYSGPLSYGRPDGKGVIFTKNYVLETEHLNDELVKSKRYEYIENLKLDDGTYTGFIHNDMPEKQGILFKGNNEIHIGEFLKGKLREGVKFLEDDTMISTIIDQKKSVSHKAIEKFKAGFFNALDELTGEGEIIKQDGTIERGNFHGGKLNGYGEREFKTEDDKLVTQKGMFENGVFKYEIRRIAGVLYSATGGATFDEKNRMNGLGKMQLPDGAIYEGNFVNGLLNGEIKCTIKNKITVHVYQAGELVKPNDKI